LELNWRLTKSGFDGIDNPLAAPRNETLLTMCSAISASASVTSAKIDARIWRRNTV